MVRLNSCCCGLCDVRTGARNIAIISMGYDLLMMAALLLVLLIHVPSVQFFAETSTEIYKILLIITITIRSLHLIPSFLVLYSTWEEIPRGVTSWLFMGVLDVILHLTWVGVPFLMKWPLDRTVILVPFLILAVIIILYFILIIKSYGHWLHDRHHDLRAKRRLKEDY